MRSDELAADIALLGTLFQSTLPHEERRGG